MSNFLSSQFRSGKMKPVLITGGTIAIILNLPLLLMQQFGVPKFLDDWILADHHRRVEAAGGGWCVQGEGEKVDRIFYGDECKLID